MSGAPERYGPARLVATPTREGGVRVVGPGMRYRRSRRSELMIWWREIDRVLLGLILTLVAIGVVAVAAASPASAERLSTAKEQLPSLYFFWPHVTWVALGLIAMFVVSLLPKDAVRRLGIMLCGAMIVALLLVPLIGAEVNGARRWLWIGFNLQPAEFLKPGFAILLAWVLTWRVRDPNIPVHALSAGVLGLIVALLMLQPDFGSAVLFCGVWFVLMLLCGLSFQKVAWAIAGLAAFVVVAYFTYDNAAHRIDSFLGGGAEFDQVDLAQKTLRAGGWTGAGLWLGVRKLALPEAHTDYIFSVIGEEFGLIACAAVIILYAAIVARVLLRLAEEEDLFTVLAATGLITQLAGQAFLNIAVNLQLAPSKGMTLPLISYGGSSTIALLLGTGFLLAITRRNPFLSRPELQYGARR